MALQNKSLDLKNVVALKDDVMNSQEEKEILLNIYQSLTNVGYIRANFNGLTAFDKIAGGLMWCITGTDNLVNIGFLYGYGEDLNIKKKILLSERIINALLHTRCPLILQPHQVMGLDVEKIIIVVQWLLAQNYKFSDTTHNIPSHPSAFITLKTDQSFSANIATVKNIISILQKHQPLRKFRPRIPSVIIDDVDRKSHEFVYVAYRNKVEKSVIQERDLFIQDESTTVYPIEFDFFDEVDHVENRDNHYSLLSQELYLTPERDDKTLAIEEKYKCESILESLQENYDQLSQEIAQSTAELENVQLTNEEVESKLLASSNHIKENENHQEILNMVVETKNIRDEYSNLRAQFLDKQKKSQEEMRIICEENFSRGTSYIHELNTHIAEIEKKLLDEDKDIYDLETLLDQPGPAELAMYQRRFYELYDQIAANTIETKQFYDLHNTLIDSKHYIEKEINLLNSVLDNYSRAMSSANFRDQFFNQLESIVDWVTQTKSKISLILSSKKELRDNLHQQWAALMELEREYATVVNQLNSIATPERRIRSVNTDY